MMKKIELEEFDVNTITSITPRYDFDNPAGGRFVVKVGDLDELSFSIAMSNAINYKLEEEEREGVSNLFDFISNNFQDQTLSHAVEDLYDLGFPVQQWVVDYISYLNTKRKDYSAMLSLLAALQNFNDEDETL